MSNTYIFQVPICPSCNTCEHWRIQESESALRKEVLGRCDHLDNDFCCGGRETHEAGVIGGGNFITKKTFWCKFWTLK